MRDRDERPYLACCEKAKTYRLIRLAHVSQGIGSLYDGLGGKLADIKPMWTIRVPGHEQMRLADEHRSIREKKGEEFTEMFFDYGDMPVMPAPIECCPFCGEKVPKVVKNPCPPPWICFCSDGGYYCDTCNERLMNCGCAPAEALWTSPPAKSDRRRWAAVWFGVTEDVPGRYYLGPMTPQMRHLVEHEWWDHFEPEDGNPESGRLNREQNREYFDELVEAQKVKDKAAELVKIGFKPILSWHR